MGLGWGRAEHTTSTVALGCADYVQHVFGSRGFPAVPPHTSTIVPGCPATYQYNRSLLSRHIQGVAPIKKP